MYNVPSHIFLFVCRSFHVFQAVDLLFSLFAFNIIQSSTSSLIIPDFMDSLNHAIRADAMESFNLISRYLDDLLNTDNPWFEGMVIQIYPPGLQLNKANTTDTFFGFTSFYCNGCNSSSIDDYAVFFCCTPVGRASDSQFYFYYL